MIMAEPLSISPGPDRNLPVLSATRWWQIKRSQLTFGGRLPWPHQLALGLAAWFGFITFWQYMATSGASNTALLPTPWEVLTALRELFFERQFATDVGHSLKRIFVSFGLALAIALPIGLLMGSFPAAESFGNALVSPFRYLPAPSFVPLLLMWLGTGDGQKIALLILGVVFFLITLFMDNTRQVHRDLVECARTFGARGWTLMTKVIFPAALPHYMTTARQMLAVSWTYLVIAEIVAATNGIGAMMMRARRVIQVDDIMAGILIIGILGMICDLSLRFLHRKLFPYLY